jgi:hypothetical protein
LKTRGDNRAKQVATEIEASARANEYDAHWESRRRPMLDFSEENDTEATALSLKALSLISPASQIQARRRVGLSRIGRTVTTGIPRSKPLSQSWALSTMRREAGSCLPIIRSRSMSTASRC